MNPAEQVDLVFGEILAFTAQAPLPQQGLAHVKHLLQQVQFDCQQRNISIPKTLLEAHNPHSLNQFVQKEVSNSEARVEANTKKMRMFQLSHALLSASSLQEKERVENKEGKEM